MIDFSERLLIDCVIKKILTIALLVTQLGTASATELLPQGTKGEPVEILSDTLRMFKIQNKAIFEGKVKAVQGDMKLDCDYMTVYFEKRDNSQDVKPDGEQTKVKLIEFTGNVVIITKGDKATGGRGIYDVKSGVFNLFDDVHLYQKKNVLTGDKLVYNRYTGESVLSKNDNLKRRVKALLIPEDESGDK
jgi:lipopolysaccharide export system protein LptA